jgi:hypothetical protein
MPVLGTLFIFTAVILRLIGILVASSQIIILFGLLLIMSYVRERLRACKYRIKNGQIKKQCIVLNKIKKSCFEIGLVGDIMRMKNVLRGYKLKFSPSVKLFFNGVNVIVGNLEGVITSQKGVLVNQGLQIKIIEELENLLANQDSKWLLCVSNNHSADFGPATFNQSICKILKNTKFSIFGPKNAPKTLLKNRINIASASEWSNKDYWQFISKYSNTNLKSYHCHDKLNILYPHWGYENERYARIRIQKDAKALLTGKTQKYTGYQELIRSCYDKKIMASKSTKWDMIFGHHSHVRQPLMYFEDDDDKSCVVKKLVVFSGGNFTSGALIIRKRKHTRGIILKCKIGPLVECPTKLGIGRVTWRYSRIKSKKGNRKVRRVYVVRTKEKLYRFFVLGFIIFMFGLVLMILL